MDFGVTVKFDDDLERVIHVDDVLEVEMPFEPEFLGGSILVDYDDQEIWAYLSKSEVWKVERYNPKIIKRTAGIRVATRAILRNPLLEWLARDDGVELPTSALPALLRNWRISV
jgi:hypothetical protein